MDILHAALGLQGMDVPCIVKGSLLQSLTIRQEPDNDCPPDGTAAHLQHHFFFGLLQKFHNALGIEWDASWFIRNDQNGERTVFTMALLEQTIPAMLSNCILPALQSGWPDLNKAEITRYLTRGLLGSSDVISDDFVEQTQNARLSVTTLLYEYVRASNAALKASPPFATHADSVDYLQSTAFKVLLSIGVLYETLKEIFISLFFFFEFGEGLLSNDIEEMSVNAEILISILQHVVAKKGWCLARTSGFEKCLSAWYLLHILPKPGNDVHSCCQPKQCSARHVTLPATSVSYHTSQCDGACAVLYVDNKHVIDMLERR